MKTVSVLFARADSIYKTLSGCDVWDADRDAMRFTGSSPVVAHPPCRMFGRLRKFSNAPAGERLLAHRAVELVKKNGGILEHPATSSLWKECGLPLPNKKNRGIKLVENSVFELEPREGFTLSLPQYWFGHRAWKLTWLYFSGIRPEELPEIPFVLGEASHVVSQSKRRGSQDKPEISKAEREHTPVVLAEWLVEAARRCRRA